MFMYLASSLYQILFENRPKCFREDFTFDYHGINYSAWAPKLWENVRVEIMRMLTMQFRHNWHTGYID